MKYQGMLITDLSGRAGGVVAARNKGGAYLRTFVTPTQPNTAIQTIARARFAAAFGAWHGLSDVQKNAWNLFATSDYKPQRGLIPGVTYSGASAFTSLRMTAFGMQDYRDAAALISAPAVTATYGTYTMPTIAPSVPFNAIPTVSGVPAPILLQSATMTTAGVLTAVFEISGGIAAAVAPVFTDFASGLTFGMGLYASLPGVQAQSYKPNPGFTLLSSIGPPLITALWVSASTFTVSLAVPTANLTAHKLWYVAGDIIRITAFGVASITGQSQPLGSANVTLT